ncbi:MAG: hypothetical protein HYW07_20515 [Candidatus Latescibacteria bacterium]|nr:hypothetical protein [Candidatus Latescibacterota bacterium]
MEPFIWDQVEAILGSGIQFCLAATGGGSQAGTWLLNHPGASRAVLEFQVPYGEGALAAYLGRPGPHGAELETARAMAARGFARARDFAQEGRGVLGVGCTAALATTRARRGEDRAAIALRSAQEYQFFQLQLEKGAAERLAQEEVLSQVILQAIGEGCGLPPGETPLPGWASVVRRNCPVCPELEQLLGGEAEVLELGLEGGFSLDPVRRDRLLFPGSFNPLHQGHEGLARAAVARSGRPVALELAVENVDKPPLAYEEVLRRLEALRGRYPVVVTRAPIFAQKALLFPGCWFAVGVDTAFRLVDPKYYRGGQAEMEEGLAQMLALGCRFLVAGRLCEGRYQTLEEVGVPAIWRPLLLDIPESAFRADVSSSALRAAEGKG